MAAFPKPPRQFINNKPSKKAIYLGGHALDFMALVEALNCDHGYLSKVLSGARTPSLPFAEAVAGQLGWTVTQLLEAIKARRQTR